MKVYPSLIDRLKTQHQAIAQIISGTPASRLLLRPQPGKWNVMENIAHLVAYQPVFIERLNLILLEDKPGFGRYKADDDAEFVRCSTMQLEPLLMLLEADRKHICDLVKILNETQLSRIGMHKKFGPLNMVQWTEFFLLHEAHHMFTIFQLVNDVDLA